MKHACASSSVEKASQLMKASLIVSAAARKWFLHGEFVKRRARAGADIGLLHSYNVTFHVPDHGGTTPADGGSRPQEFFHTLCFISSQVYPSRAGGHGAHS